MTEITNSEIRQKLGNIGLLRDLLFGEQMQKYEAKIGQHERQLEKIESEFQAFKTTTKEYLEQLEAKLLQKIDTVNNSTEQKMQYLSTTNQERQQKLDLELKRIEKSNGDSIDFLQSNINEYSNNLKLQITQSKAANERDLQLLKRQIFEKLESSLAELSSTKLSRTDLAEVLFELCLKLKGSKIALEPVNSQTSAENTDNGNSKLILPENS